MSPETWERIRVFVGWVIFVGGIGAIAGGVLGFVHYYRLRFKSERELARARARAYKEMERNR